MANDKITKDKKMVQKNLQNVVQIETTDGHGVANVHPNSEDTATSSQIPLEYSRKQHPMAKSAHPIGKPQHAGTKFSHLSKTQIKFRFVLPALPVEVVKNYVILIDDKSSAALVCWSQPRFQVQLAIAGPVDQTAIVVATPPPIQAIGTSP